MNYRIVAGVDGSEGGRRALRWAAAEAMARHGSVQAITVWNWDGTGSFAPMATSPQEERQRAEQILAAEVSAVRADFPTVEIAAEAVEGHPARELTVAAAGGSLLVLGSHGHSRMHQAVLGSISEECVRRAGCPVVVLPVPRPVAEPADPKTVVAA